MGFEGGHWDLVGFEGGHWFHWSQCVFTCPRLRGGPDVSDGRRGFLRMAALNREPKGKRGDGGLGTAVDFLLSNAKLVLGVGGAAVLGIATLAVKRVR